MQPEDKFLFTFVYKSASRGRHYVLRKSDLGELADKWLVELAQVDAEKCRQGLLSPMETQRMLAAGAELSRLLLYMLVDEELPEWWPN